MTDRNHLRKEERGLILTRGFRLMMEKLLWQKLEAADHILSTVRKQKDINTNDAHLASSF